MQYNFTQEQKEELEKIGELYRETIYDSSLKKLPDIVKAFLNGLKKINGEISLSISGEVLRFYKLIISNYSPKMRDRIDILHEILSEKLSKDISFTITCRQKSWESVLRKILKYYFEGASLSLYDLVALRITIDSDDIPEEDLEKICHQISDICINFFIKQMCTLMPPAKLVANNPLIKDYINYPKPNGYKSIHLAFMDDDNNIFEVQIRTILMDIDAEYGPEHILENDDEDIDDDLNHNNYKDSEYEGIIDFIFFDLKKVNKSFLRTFRRKNRYTKKYENIIIDKIGLMYAKHVEERAHTF